MIDAALVIDKPITKYFPVIDGTGHDYALHIACSNAHISAGETFGASNKGVVIAPRTIREIVEDSSFTCFNNYEHGGSGVVLNANKGYVRRCRIDVIVSNCGASYPRGQHGVSLYGGGQLVLGGGKPSPRWSWWRDANKSVVTMRIMERHENMLYKILQITSDNEFVKRQTLIPGDKNNLKSGEWDLDYSNLNWGFVDLYVNIGLSADYLNEGIVRFMLYNEACTHNDISFIVNNQIDNGVNQREGHGGGADNDAHFNYFRKMEAYNCDGFGGFINGGRGNIIEQAITHGNKRGDIVILSNTQELLIRDYEGDTDEIKWAKNKDIDVKILNYKQRT